LVPSIIYAQSTLAFTYYQQNQEPSFLLSQANPYTVNNPFGPKNFRNPYHEFWNPYSPNSVRNDFQRFSAPIVNFDDTYQGRLSNSVKDPNTITNPYGRYGNAFSSRSVANQYQPIRRNNPYGEYQQVYNANSIRHNPKFSEHYYDSHGNYLGSALNNSYKNRDSIFDPYNHSAFNSTNATNPFGYNKTTW
jgi:hypothetical protein